MKIQPVEPTLYFPNQAVPPSDRKNEEQAEELEASKEVNSLWYATTLQSLREAAEPTDPKFSENALSAVEGNKQEKSFVRKLQDWLWGAYHWIDENVSQLLCLEKKEKSSAVSLSTPTSTNERNASSTVPKLEPPLNDPQMRLKQMLLDFNREMSRRLKEIEEFEEEMRLSNSNKLDKLIFLHFVSTTLRQKEIKEGASTISNEQLLKNLNKNKAIHKTYYSLADEIKSLTKTSATLHWIQVGAVTAGVAGSLALAFATGGVSTLLMIALPLASLTGGVTKMAEGTLRYQAQLKEGELFIVSQETKENHSRTKEELSTLQGNDQEISLLLKSIRRQLEEQSQAERASFSRT